MTDISAVNFASVETRARPNSIVDDHARETIVTTLLSGLLIIGFPATFWITIIEVVNYTFSLGVTVSTRLTIGGVLIVLLGLVWGFIIVSARQRRAAQLEAELSQRYGRPNWDCSAT